MNNDFFLGLAAGMLLIAVLAAIVQYCITIYISIGEIRAERNRQEDN